MGFLEENSSHPKEYDVDKFAAGSGTQPAAKFGVLKFPNGCQNADSVTRLRLVAGPARSAVESKVRGPLCTNVPYPLSLTWYI